MAFPRRTGSRVDGCRWFAWLTLGQAFTNGTPRAEFTDGILADGDIVVTGRYAFDGFVGSNLDTVLQQAEARDVLFCGFTTEHCVHYTMREAEARGYRVWLVPECTATKSARLQARAERHWQQRGQVLGLSDAIDQFHGSPGHANREDASERGGPGDQPPSATSRQR